MATGLSAARSMLLSLGFAACATGLAGCLKTEPPNVTAQTSANPVKQHLQIVGESDKPVIGDEPAQADIKNPCVALIREDDVKRIIAKRLELAQDAVTARSSWNDLRAYQLDRMEVLLDLDEAFHIEITPEDAERMATVRSVIDILREICLRKLPTSRPAATATDLNNQAPGRTKAGRLSG